MFWGITIQPNQSATVSEDVLVHITGSAIQDSLTDERLHRVFLKTGMSECCVATFSKNQKNCKTSIFLEKGEQCTLLNKTANIVYLFGYTLALPSDVDEMEDSLVVEKRVMARSKKSEKRKSFAPRKSVIQQPTSKKTVTIGGVIKTIQIESLVCLLLISTSCASLLWIVYL
ncbi:hypothetical protein EIN_097540 [Entamoeba invadens IP1]|uniref:Nucleoplasmin-like domain-containing protein n=1 Tax=Entamoeba invadens IP1 TaxID=370355 RepID=A0A0A1U0R4_ENTIV|nr:hypothetical protein EIN_097540 [Entamoeba invadens IP1]ELP87467.1 hypothetical protein EIN_097540 [Entamoeba invadens IP1]|eukprot:XP_004254238.1 hypothetical protein EIN_097540 [Entamoeba invadens IP1]